MLNCCFTVRMTMIEFFSIQEMGFGEGYYAFVSFKNVEKIIEDAKI